MPLFRGRGQAHRDSRSSSKTLVSGSKLVWDDCVRHFRVRKYHQQYVIAMRVNFHNSLESSALLGSL